MNIYINILVYTDQTFTAVQVCASNEMLCTAHLALHDVEQIMGKYEFCDKLFL